MPAVMVKASYGTLQWGTIGGTIGEYQILHLDGGQIEITGQAGTRPFRLVLDRPSLDGGFLRDFIMALAAERDRLRRELETLRGEG